MKIKLILSLGILFGLYSCSPEENIILEFDEVVYYNKDDVNSEFKSVYDCNTGEPLEDYGCDILHDSRPYLLADTTFTDSLNLIGFNYHLIDSSFFDELRNIFTEKSSFINETNYCEPIYRDLLVFRNKGSVKGVAKICFECNKTHIIGLSFKKIKYGKLEKILNKNR
jgi:hypothetical protein